MVTKRKRQSPTPTPRRRHPRQLTEAPVWFSPKEAAGYLGIGIDTIYEACAERGLRHSKLGHSTIRIRRDWLDAWMDEQAQGG